MTSPVSGQLVVSISNTVPSDSGNFTCRARSTVGSDERTGTMKVECKWCFCIAGNQSESFSMHGVFVESSFHY